MNWQDVVITVVSFTFAASLIPTIRAEHKPHLTTSLSTFIGLLACSICYFTLGLYLSVVASMFSATCWFILFIQKARNE